MRDEDENNFSFRFGRFVQHEVWMEGGRLLIDNIEYERDDEDPTYDLVREI